MSREKKRLKYRLLQLGLPLGTLSALIPSAVAQNPKSQPNIILFLVDDMGPMDTSVPFASKPYPQNKKFHTPNMERLAARGMKFTQAYACAISSPSRTSLMTGMNAARHKVTNWTLLRGKSQDHTDEQLGYPEWNLNGLQPSYARDIEHSVSATTFVSLLRESGYYTIHCGKAHWGTMGTAGEDPLNLGFQKNIAGSAIGGPASYLGERDFGQGNFHVTGLENYHGKDIFLSEALTQEALKALEAPIKRKQPFYLYMSHYAVHVPLDKDKRFYDKYRERGLDEKEAAYAALVEGMDKSLGDIMDFLQKKDIADETIIIFMSDNGGLSQHGRGGEANLHNMPYRSGKGSAYEGGIRVPMIVDYPGVTPAGSFTEHRVIIEDFYPTILELAGVKDYKTTQTIDGESFVPVLKGDRPKRVRDMFWNFPNKWIRPVLPEVGIDAYAIIRAGDWKLIYYYRTGKKELYNVVQDISEKENMAETYPKVTKLLSERLGQYLRSVKADRPYYKANGKPCSWPDE